MGRGMARVHQRRFRRQCAPNAREMPPRRGTLLCSSNPGALCHRSRPALESTHKVVPTVAASVAMSTCSCGVLCCVVLCYCVALLRCIVVLYCCDVLFCCIVCYIAVMYCCVVLLCCVVVSRYGHRERAGLGHQPEDPAAERVGAERGRQHVVPRERGGLWGERLPLLLERHGGAQRRGLVGVEGNGTAALCAVLEETKSKTVLCSAAPSSATSWEG